MKKQNQINESQQEETIKMTLEQKLEDISRKLEILTRGQEDVKQIREDMNKLTTLLTNHIENLGSSVFQLQTEKDRLNTKVKKLIEENTDLRNKVSQQQKEAVNQRLEVNNMEQDGRQGNVRVYGVREEPQGKTEMVADCIKKCTAILSSQVGVPVSVGDIENAHRSGRPVPGNARPSLVRFFSRQKRGAVLESRRKLKQTGISIGISAVKPDFMKPNWGRSNTQFMTDLTQNQMRSGTQDPNGNLFQKQGDVSRRTPQPSTSDRTSQHKSSNTSGSLLPLDRSHVCQRCSAAFVLFGSLKLHMAYVHGEKLQPAVPVVSTPDRCDIGNSLNIDKKVGNLGDGNTVEKMKDTVKDRKTMVKTKGTVEDKKANLRGTDRVIEIDTDKIDLKRNKRHVCDVCSKAFNQACKLKTHKLIHTGLKPFVCDVCSKAFSEAGTLKRHKLIHTGLKPFVCDVCSKAFNQARTLKTHKLIHTGLKPFVCDVCSKAFNRASNLNKHKRIHTGERPYKCPHCDVDFNDTSHLQTHIRAVHAGDKPYVCDVCGAAFSQTGVLRSHIRAVHEGDKPFVCDVCGVAFSRTGNLKIHQRIHTVERPYTCPH